MSDSSSANNPLVLAEIVLAPLEDEADDFETLSAIEDVTADVLSDTASLQNYTTQIASEQRSGADVIILFSKIAHEALAQKDLLIAFLQAGAAAIGVLGKQRRVRKIEMSLDGDSIHIENPDAATVHTLLALYEAKHPGKTANVTVSSKLQVTGKVSKKAHPTSK